ncbi:MAG: GHMP kinase [Chloroflexi bacterium]|nr:GHMP kinase [Anaerolineaceae bacterium]NMB89829.1 GHMP kinase [Chloroflexota bacterium]
MIIVQTPLRVSLFGGGTDFPSFYTEEGGAVLTTAIDKYIFVTIKKRFDEKLRIGYTKTEMVDHVDEIQHELIRECLVKTGIRKGIEITTMGDIPSAGSGLGSSSTVTVGSLHAMYHYLGEIVSYEQLAREACEIEINTLGKPIGIQDQYIAAYGGLRFIEFTQEGEIRSEKIQLDGDTLRAFNENLLLFFTGITRSASDILVEQKTNINHRIPILRRMKEMAYIARDEIKQGNLDVIGKMLDEHWHLKKEMAQKISNGTIDELYQSACEAGALGGKIAGAGGGGFLLVYVPHDRQRAVRKALNCLQELPFNVEDDGTKVIFNYRRS